MIVSFYFGGTVNNSVDTTILVGDNIQGSCVYDSTQSQQGSTGIYNFTGSAKVHSFSIKDYRDGSQITNDQFVGGAPGFFEIVMNRSTMTINGVTIVGRRFQMVLTNPSHSGNSLPTSMTGWNMSNCVINIVPNF